MLIYFMILAPALVLSWARPSLHQKLTLGLIVYFCILLIFMGLRDETGADWFGYVNIFGIIKYGTEYKGKEFIFQYVNVLSDYLGYDVYGVTFICTAVFLVGIFSFALATPQPWLAIAMVLPYLGFIVGMSGIRQAAAIGICYTALARWEKLSLVVRLGSIGVAAGFHTSAVLMTPLLLFQTQRYFKLKILLSAIVMVAGIRASADDVIVADYVNRYYTLNVQSSGAFQHVVLSAFPSAIYLLLKRRFESAGLARPIITIGAWISLAALPLVFLSSTGSDRFALYFSYVQMWVYPAIVSMYGKKNHAVISAFTTTLSLMIFLIYFTFGVTVKQFVPYKTIMFSL